MTNYSTFNEDMVGNSSILAAITTDEGGLFVDALIADKKSDQNEISAIFMIHEALTYAKGACKSCIMRAAFLAASIL